MLRSSAPYLFFCLLALLSLSYHNADVIAHKELEQYCHEDGTDERSCHNDLLPRSLPHVLNRTPNRGYSGFSWSETRPHFDRSTVERPCRQEICCCCCCCFSNSAHWLPTRKTTLHDGQSRSWFAEQRKKEKKRKCRAATPASPPPTLHSPALLVRRKKKSRESSTCLGATHVGVTQMVSVRLACVQGFLQLVG